MQLQALRYFIMVANTGSFVATAKYFQVPPSSVSRFISALEKEVGQQLFYRNTRSVKLTDIGESYFIQIRDVLDQLDFANEQITGKNSEIKGLVRINAPVALGRLHIVQMVSRLMTLYPQLSVELVLTDTFIDPVQDGIDIVMRVGVLQDSALVARKVCDQNYVLCASPSYIARAGMPTCPEDLENHACLVYKGMMGIQKWYFRKASQTTIVQPQGQLKSNNAEVLVQAALEGKGIVLFPTWIFQQKSFKHNKLQALLTDWTAGVDPHPIEIHLVSPENRIRSLKVRTVIDFILQEIGHPPYWDNL
ncbi:MAG: LysR family transcriptional regulator [Acinetobacter sp.]